MISKAVSLVMIGALWLPAFGENARRPAALPNDPLEMVTGQTWAASAETRAGALRLLARARQNYDLRSAGRAYDLKVSFTVNSSGQTAYDGAWKMEEIFDPSLGYRWNATAPGSYVITRISSNGKSYEERTANYVPLRLQEARAALFDPIASTPSIQRASIRTATATFNGASSTCVLLSGGSRSPTANTGRRWDETEECIDPATGLLQVHSQVPGRYYAYDYSDALQFAGRIVPRKVIVTEGGNTVTTISVDSLIELPGGDPSLFQPTAAMRENGRAIAMGGAQKLWRTASGPLASGATADTVCVFGVVGPSGELLEAHSLQPSDANSQAAVEAAKKIPFASQPPFGASPQQHFVFVIEEFPASQ